MSDATEMLAARLREIAQIEDENAASTYLAMAFAGFVDARIAASGGAGDDALAESDAARVQLCRDLDALRAKLEEAERELADERERTRSMVATAEHERVCKQRNDCEHEFAEWRSASIDESRKLRDERLEAERARKAAEAQLAEAERERDTAKESAAAARRVRDVAVKATQEAEAQLARFAADAQLVAKWGRSALAPATPDVLRAFDRILDTQPEQPSANSQCGICACKGVTIVRQVTMDVCAGCDDLHSLGDEQPSACSEPHFVCDHIGLGLPDCRECHPRRQPSADERGEALPLLTFACACVPGCFDAHREWRQCVDGCICRKLHARPEMVDEPPEAASAPVTHEAGGALLPERCDDEALVHIANVMSADRRAGADVVRAAVYEVRKLREAVHALDAGDGVRDLADEALKRAENALAVSKSKPSHIAIPINNTIRTIKKLRAALAGTVTP